jgi:type IX secretion system PorP/SprF family membrane protein
MKAYIDFNQRVDQFKWIKGLMTLVSLVVLSMISTSSFAQVESMYSSYRLNPQILSPTHVGSDSVSDITVINRQQWVGIEGAPMTYAISGDFKFKQQSGIGFNAMYDQAGPVKVTAISGDYAYHIKLNEAWRFSGGIRAGFSNLSLDFAGLALVHDGDALFSGSRSTGLSFNTGWGLKINKGDGFFVSLSQPRLFKYDLGSGSYKDVAYFYTMVGTKLAVSENVVLYPSALFRTAKDVPLSWDANVYAQLNKRFDVGLNYRHQDSWGVRLGLQATKKIYVGYVYEMPTSAMSKMSVQSHEIALRYSLTK